mgnify:CR=1 FL=1
MRRPALLLGLLGWLLGSLLPGAALAHPAGLVRVAVTCSGTELRVGVRSPGEPVDPPSVSGCTAVGSPRTGAGDEWTWRTWECPEGLEGVALDLAAVDPSGARVAVELRRDGAVHSLLVDPRAGPWPIPTDRPASGPLLTSFVRLGILHILGGVDHLLFIAGLLFLVTGPRRLLLTLTAFTLGHSVTLAVCALGGPSPAPAPAEAWIAGSIVLLGRELLRQEPERTGRGRHPGVLAALFGLVHGFGFAGALQQVGLPPTSTLWALGGFNLGVEVGQILFVAAVGMLAWLTSRWLGGTARRGRLVTAWLLGVAGSYWLVDRVLALG